MEFLFSIPNLVLDIVVKLLVFFWDYIVIGAILYILRKKFGDNILNMIGNSERIGIIWDHYKLWGNGDDRHSSDVTECSVDKCATI